MASSQRCTKVRDLTCVITYTAVTQGPVDFRALYGAIPEFSEKIGVLFQRTVLNIVQTAGAKKHIFVGKT